MNHLYTVELMARRDGSIGQFYPTNFTLSAATVIEVRFNAIEKAREKGLETHHIIGVTRVFKPT